MFESDDYDQILSQFDFPDSEPKTCNQIEVQAEGKKQSLNQQSPLLETANIEAKNKIEISYNTLHNGLSSIFPRAGSEITKGTEISPKHSKRKVIDSYFDYKTKRKFPGPAGLLTGSLQESKDDAISHMELLSQDIDYSQNHLKRGSFELPLWKRLLEDMKKWNTGEVNTIKSIKQQAVNGNLRQRKAQTVTAFVETVDRSATDPLIVLRDNTGNIKGTLHRDAWSIFSPYIVAENCALVLWKPTVLTTGSAFKKHYLNITLSNIYAIYSSSVLQEDLEVNLPDDYIKDFEDEFTIIKNKESPENLGINLSSSNVAITNENDLLDGLDSIFSDELF